MLLNRSLIRRGPLGRLETSTINVRSWSVGAVDPAGDDRRRRSRPSQDRGSSARSRASSSSGGEEGQVAGGHQLAEDRDVDRQQDAAVQGQAREDHPGPGRAEPEQEGQGELDQERT